MKLAASAPCHSVVRSAVRSAIRSTVDLCVRRAECQDRGAPWRLLVAIGATSMLLQMPLHAKPIDGCLVQEADLVDPTACLSPPERLTSIRPTSRTYVAPGRDKVARVTLDNIDSGAAGAPQQTSNMARCAELRGTHEAQRLMLQSLQKRLSAIERDRRSANNTLRSLRSSGADEVQLTNAAGRLTKMNAVWSVLKGDVEARTKRFNKSMSQLTKACLRG